MNQIYVNTDGFTFAQNVTTPNRYLYTTNGITLADGITLNLTGLSVPASPSAGCLGIVGNITNTGSVASTVAITGNSGTTAGSGIRILSRVTAADTGGTNTWSVNVNIKATGTGGVIFSETASHAWLVFRNPIVVDNGSRLVLSPGSGTTRTIFVSNSITTSSADALSIGETGNTGLVVLGGNNVITGNLNVIGQLSYQGSRNALGSATVVLSQGSTFGQSGAISGGNETIANPISIQGDTTFGTSTNMAGANIFTNYFGGNIDLAAGTRTVAITSSSVLSGAVTNGSLVYTNTSVTRSIAFNGSLNLTNLSILGRGTTTLGAANTISNLVISNSLAYVVMTGTGGTLGSITVNSGSLGAAGLGNGSKNLTLSGVGATATFSNTATSGSMAVGPLSLGGSNNFVMTTSGSTAVASSGAITLSGTSNVITLNGSALAVGTYQLFTGTSVSTNGLTGPVTLTGTGVASAANLVLDGPTVLAGPNFYTFRSTSTALELQIVKNPVNDYAYGGGTDALWNTDPANTIWNLGGTSTGFTSATNSNASINTANAPTTLTLDSGGITALYVDVAGGSAAILNGGALSANRLSTTSTGLTVNIGVVATNFSVTNSTVTGTGSISTSGGTTVQCDTDQSLSVALTGTGGVTKSGPGTLTVSDGSTYSGNLVVTSGALATSGSAAIPDIATLVLSNLATLNLGGNETVGGLNAAFGSFINLGNYTLTAGGNNSSFTNGATITGTGGLVKNGTGQMWLNNSTNTFSGGFVLNSGEVAYTSSGAAASGVITNTVFGRGTVTLNGGSFGSSSSSSGRNLHNSVILNGNIQFGQTAWGLSTTNLNGGSPNLTVTTNGAGTTTLASDSTINTIGSVQWDQPISGNYRLTKTGTGAVSLSNNFLSLRASNNIAGVTVLSGSLGYKNRNALGTGTLILG
ncbi:hypothetical protein EBX31_09580, partial [bacterium]|nr:hypothetical protein [bacterium]